MTSNPEQEHLAPVLSMTTYSKARRALAALIGLLHEPEWLVSATLTFSARGEPSLRVVVTNAERFARVLPASVDHFPVVIEDARGANSYRGA
jgi:hypothetical protein